MSVNTRFALAVLALGHDQRRPEPPGVPTPTVVSVRKQDSATSAIADLAAAWLKRTVRRPGRR